MNIKASWFIAANFSLISTLAGAAEKPVDAAAAKAKALALFPGKVLEVEKEKFKGEPVFSVEIKAGAVVHEIVIRITDGKVLADKVKGPHDEEKDGHDNEDEDEDEDED